MDKLGQWKDQFQQVRAYKNETSDVIIACQMIVAMLALIQRPTTIDCDSSGDQSTKLKMLTALATVLVRKHGVIAAVENVSRFLF